MKKIIALSAVAVLFAGCASQEPAENSQLAALTASVEEARAAAIRADQNAQAALALAQQNAQKIEMAFGRRMRK